MLTYFEMEAKDSTEDTIDTSSIVQSLKIYLRGVCPCLLNLDGPGLNVMDSKLESDETTEILSKFVTSIDTMTLYVEKCILDGSLNSEGIQICTCAHFYKCIYPDSYSRIVIWIANSVITALLIQFPCHKVQRNAVGFKANI